MIVNAPERTPFRHSPPLPVLARAAVTLLSLSLLAGCQMPRASAPATGESSLASAEHYHRTADRTAKKEPATALGHYLASASIALDELATADTSTRSDALDLYNTSVAQAALLHIDSDNWTAPVTIPGPDRSFTLTTVTPRRELIDHRDFDSLVDAASLKLRQVDERHTRSGLGAPLVAYREGTPERIAREPFLSESGLAMPVTATLDFPGGDRAVLTFHPVDEIETVRIAGRTWPLAADFTAPLATLIEHAPKENISFKGLVHPEKYIDSTGLFQMEPFDPKKIPVILVHGLKSRPMIWANAYNTLRADPVIRRRYQFLFYRYPTGFPIAYNAAGFRKRLAQFGQHYDPARRNPKMRKIVLIGHSMGGILCNTLSRSGGEPIRRKLFETPLEELDLDADAASAIHELVDFKPNPDIRRIICICTPHRGSTMAEGNIGRIGSSLVKYPVNLVLRTTTPFIEGLTDTAQDFLLNQQDSIDDLAPNSPTLQTILDLPRSGVTFHSIVGDRGRGLLRAESSDGVVPYWSSHLDFAVSEKIVPYNHGAPRYPETIEEIRRILYLHLGKTLQPAPR